MLVSKEGRALWKQFRRELRGVFLGQNISHLRKISAGSHGDVFELQLGSKRYALKVFGGADKITSLGENAVAQALAAEEINSLDLRFGKAQLVAPKSLIAGGNMLLMEFVGHGLAIDEFQKHFAHDRKLLDELDFALADFSLALQSRTRRDQYGSMVSGDRVKIQFDEKTGEFFVFMLE